MCRILILIFIVSDDISSHLSIRLCVRPWTDSTIDPFFVQYRLSTRMADRTLFDKEENQTKMKRILDPHTFMYTLTIGLFTLNSFVSALAVIVQC